jgi:prepilin-type N-terminal cleavage/methylation domain-containing protein
MNCRYFLAPNMRRGFTLVEVLVSIFIYSLIMLAVLEFLRIAYLGSSQNPLALDSIDKLRSVTTSFDNEIRSAAAGADGSYPLGQASTTQIVFFTPFGTNSTSSVYRVRYFLATSTLYKGVTIPSGSPLSYNLANEVITPVLFSATSPTSSVFFYYDGSFNGVTSTQPLAQPVNITQVTYVQINLATQMKEIRNATSTFSIITGAAIRNLKTNLGN